MGSPSTPEVLWMPWETANGYFFASGSYRRRKSRFSTPEALWMLWKHGHRSFPFPPGLIPIPNRSSTPEAFLDALENGPSVLLFRGVYSDPKSGLDPRIISGCLWRPVHGLLLSRGLIREVESGTINSGCPGDWFVGTSFPGGFSVT